MATTAEASPVTAGRKTTGWPSREHWALSGLLCATLVAYVWGADRAGWANPYYSAAAQAGAHDWAAFFFGSLDWNNAITVDKTPLAIWPMALSVRLFGLSSWSILVPQALLGVASVWMLYACTRRAFPPTVALSAALLYAATPVVFLMSRYNNPEPFMGLTGLLGLYAAIRTIHDGAWRWYGLFGLAFGLAFMAKGFQGILWLPAAAAAIAIWGAGTLKDRIVRLVASTGVAMVSGTWWITIVSSLPSTDRPFIGSSNLNNPWDLAVGYNGLGRLVPSQISDAQSVPYDGGIGRLFNANFAQEIGWTLGPAVLCLAIIAALSKRLTREQLISAVLAGSALTTTWTVLSFMADRIHTYYTYSLGAPAAIVLAIGFYTSLKAPTAWMRRVLPATVVGASTYFALRIMGYADSWGPWPMLVGTLGAGATIICAALPTTRSPNKGWAAGLLIIASATSSLAPIITDAFTANIPQTRVFPISGPTPRDPNAIAHVVDEMRTNDPNSLVVQENGAPTSPLVVADAHLPHGSWLVATYPAQNAALYQLATGQPSMAIGGWSGADPSMTLSGFQQLVADHKVEYFVGYTKLQPYFQDEEVGKIERWIDEHFNKNVADSTIVYDLRHTKS